MGRAGRTRWGESELQVRSVPFCCPGQCPHLLPSASPCGFSVWSFHSVLCWTYSVVWFSGINQFYEWADFGHETLFCPGKKLDSSRVYTGEGGWNEALWGKERGAGKAGESKEGWNNRMVFVPQFWLPLGNIRKSSIYHHRLSVYFEQYPPRHHPSVLHSFEATVFACWQEKSIQTIFSPSFPPEPLPEKGFSQTGDIVWTDSNMSVLVFSAEGFPGDLFVAPWPVHRVQVREGGSAPGQWPLCRKLSSLACQEMVSPTGPCICTRFLRGVLL